MNPLMRWVIDMLRAQEDAERRTLRRWYLLDAHLNDALGHPVAWQEGTPPRPGPCYRYSRRMEEMRRLIDDMAQSGWRWSGLGLGDMPFGPVIFRHDDGHAVMAHGGTLPQATAKAAAKALSIPASYWIGQRY